MPYPGAESSDMDKPTEVQPVRLQRRPGAPMFPDEVQAMLDDKDRQIASLEQKCAALAVENVGVYTKNRELEARLRPSGKAGNLIADLRDSEFCAGKAGNEYDQDAERHAQAITDYLAAAEDSVRDLTAQNLRLTNALGAAQSTIREQEVTIAILRSDRDRLEREAIPRGATVTFYRPDEFGGEGRDPAHDDS